MIRMSPASYRWSPFMSVNATCEQTGRSDREGGRPAPSPLAVQDDGDNDRVAARRLAGEADGVAAGLLAVGHIGSTGRYRVGIKDIRARGDLVRTLVDVDLDGHVREGDGRCDGDDRGGLGRGRADDEWHEHGRQDDGQGSVMAAGRIDGGQMGTGHELVPPWSARSAVVAVEWSID